MHPAFSVIFLTTLIGVGQGFYLALYTGEVYAVVQLLPPQDSLFYAQGSLITTAFLIGGLVASFFHLGHPERAWRSVSQWRTSWLSREVIILPIVIGLVVIYGLLHYLGWDLRSIGVDTGVRGDLTLIVGALGLLATFALFVCTGMIYAAIRFLPEWATPLTVLNYILFGGASGFVLAAAYAGYVAPELTQFYGVWAIIITLAAWTSRTASLVRNARLRYKSSLQTAVGVRHTHIVQRSQGFMGGSFNTREFFHRADRLTFNTVKWLFIVFTFVVPVGLLAIGLYLNSPQLLLATFIVQYLGLLAERWFFFAQASHPQNLYYQTMS